MNTLKILMRLRWLIILGLLAIAWMTYKPVAYVLTTVACCAMPFDLMMTLLPAGRRKADQARRAQIKAESRRMLDQP